MSAALSAEFGRRDDEKAWIKLSEGKLKEVTFIWPGPVKGAALVAQRINALGKAEAALKAVRKDCRDPDTDSALSAKAGELVDDALAALGVKP